MAIGQLFPTPAGVEAGTPATRDRAIDVVRIVSLVGVVLGHTIMATSALRDDVFIWSNLLTASPVFQALTWVFQIMPLFFFAGVAASIDSWKPGTSWGNWLMRRCTRLYRPVFYYLAFWGVTLLALRVVLPEHIYEPVAGISIQLLWFLGAYVMVLAAVALLYRITATGRLVTAIAGVYTVVAVVDGGGYVAGPGGRSAAVGVLLCIAGAATLASVGWGLKDQGLYCIAVMLAALVAARRLANRSCDGTPGDARPARAASAA